MTTDDYRTWNPRSLPDPHTASLAEVTEGLLEIVDAEGPIICRRAYALYNKAVGGSRLGRQTVKIMNRAVYRAIRLGRLTHGEGRAVADQAVQIVGRPPVVPRRRGPRRLDEIPPTEIAQTSSYEGKWRLENKFQMEDRLTKTSIGVPMVGVFENFL